jgi:hypothetical protein
MSNISEETIANLFKNQYYWTVKMEVVLCGMSSSVYPSSVSKIPEVLNRCTCAFCWLFFLEAEFSRRMGTAANLSTLCVMR